jgi:hypothetical protein
MERQIFDVIGKMLVEIPDELPFLSLKEQLKSVQKSSMYTAPECMGELWNLAGSLLNSHLPQENLTEWQKNIASIFSNATGEQLLTE